MASNKKPQVPRVTVTADRFHQHLAEQIGYLRASCRAFDLGELAEFKRIASAIRTLVHDTGNSTSLLTHLGEKDIEFVNSAYPYNPSNLMNHHGLIALGMTNERNGYFAICQLPDGFGKSNAKPFDDWWSEPVIKDGSGRFLTRKDLVLIAANQDGGSHVDGTIDETYEDLARQNSLGWMSSDDGGTPLDKAEAFSLRQIGWEVLETLQRREARLKANEKCECGSGRKHRYCCGKSPTA